MCNSKSLLATLAAALVVAGTIAAPSHVSAQEAPAAEETTVVVEAVVEEKAAAEPSVEQRLADLEAYINNAARTPDVASKVNVPGPGHNAWQMASTALGPLYDTSRLGAFLWWIGPVRKCALDPGHVHGSGRLGYDSLVAVRIQSDLWRNESVHRRSEFCHVQRDVSGGCGAGYYWISDYVWAMFQLTFAIITPALIFGATAERMKFGAVLLFTGIWMFLVYFPLAHMVWSTSGFMCGPLNPNAGIKAIDFAGGTVVHMSSGWTALVLCLILGPRLGFGKEPMPPHSMVLCMVGTGMLYVGWFGFNAGSALGADAIASNAFTTTMLAAATGGFVWAVMEWFTKGHPSVLGFCSGIVAGLVVVTPACGFVTPAEPWSSASLLELSPSSR